MDDLISLIPSRRGHFELQSGYHGELWLDLDRLFLRPQRLQPFVSDLAAKLSGHGAEAVCGSLTGGAFVAQMVAAELDLEFYWVAHRIPSAVRGLLRDKPVAIVDDVINAGSSVRGALGDLEACGARPVAIGALLVLGPSAASLAAAAKVPLEQVAYLENSIWLPAECPLCTAGAPLEETPG